MGLKWIGIVGLGCTSVSAEGIEWMNEESLDWWMVGL